MWKFIYDSVEGTSHRHGNSPCQDSSFVSCLRIADAGYLLAVCSDGAGSAAESKAGSQLACDEIASQVQGFLSAGHRLEDLNDEVVQGWLGKVREGIQKLAEARELTPRDFACTLLVSIVADHASAFVQIGDGVIVVHEGDSYRHVFWPQTGEYQNTTFFVTDDTYQSHLQWHTVPIAPREIAMMTDGLQMLALNYTTKIVHQPFFGPMFAALRGAAEITDLQVPLQQFLNSESVNARTDDDKTLILATRVVTDAAAAT